MNHPYVKQYKNGIVINPIIGSYMSNDLNRKQRRESQQKRTPSERKNYKKR